MGASGYAGAELLRILAAHPDLDLAAATASSQAGARLTDLYPSLAGAYPDLVLQPLEPGTLDGLDVAFLALPHGESQRLVPDLLGRVAHVVDLGADFRLPAATYQRWYGEAHAAPALARPLRVRPPRAVPRPAHPGPLGRRARLLPDRRRARPRPAAGHPPRRTDRAGRQRRLGRVRARPRASTTPSLFSEANETVSAYSLLTHRHTGEIEHALGEVARRPGVGALHPPPRPHDPRAARHLLRPPRHDRAHQHRAPRHLPRLLRRRAVRHRPRRPPDHQGHPRVELGARSPCATTTAPGPSSPSARSTTS